MSDKEIIVQGKEVPITDAEGVKPVPMLAHGDYKPPQLTLEARAAVRAYLWTIIAPVFAASGVILFVLGFFVNDAVKGNANIAAYDRASGEVETLKKQAAMANQEAQAANISAQESRANSKKSADEAEELRVKLKVNEAGMKEAKFAINEIADTLAIHPTFIKRVSDSANKKAELVAGLLEAANIEIDRLKLTLKTKADIDKPYRLRAYWTDQTWDAAIYNGRGGNGEHVTMTLPSNEGQGTFWSLVEAPLPKNSPKAK